MLRLFIAATILLGASAAAFAQPVTLTVVNNSSSVISGLNTFPLGDDGVVVDDNIGGFYDPVPPGGAGKAELSMYKCGIVLAIVTLEGEQELRANINLCDDQTLVVND